MWTISPLPQLLSLLLLEWQPFFSLFAFLDSKIHVMATWLRPGLLYLLLAQQFIYSILSECFRLLSLPTSLALSFFLSLSLSWLSQLHFIGPPGSDPVIDIVKDWLPLVLSVFSVGYLGWRAMRRGERQAQMEYFEKKAADLEKRLDTLQVSMEKTLARYRMMKDYVFDILGPSDTITINAQMILDGHMDYKRRINKGEDDITETH